MSFSSFVAKLKQHPMVAIKYIGIGVVVLFLLSVLLPYVPQPSATPFQFRTSYGEAEESYAGEPHSLVKHALVQDMVYDGDVADMHPASGIIAPEPPYQPGSVGNMAEDFEVTEYSAHFEPRDAQAVCNTIAAMKPKQHVVFQSANEYDKGCDYTLKVEHAHVSEMVTLLESLDPKDLSEYTYTIQKQLQYLESEQSILEKKLSTIDATLTEAVRAYDEIALLAERSLDASSLASVIESKLSTIERLTREKITVRSQLDRIAKRHAEQLDRMAYTMFHISVYESSFFDGEELAQSWKYEVRQFFVSINASLQQLTIGFVSFLFAMLWYVLYGFVLLLIAKYGWRFVIRFWKR